MPIQPLIFVPSLWVKISHPSFSFWPQQALYPLFFTTVPPSVLSSRPLSLLGPLQYDPIGAPFHRSIRGREKEPISHIPRPPSFHSTAIFLSLLSRWAGSSPFYHVFSPAACFSVHLFFASFEGILFPTFLSFLQFLSRSSDDSFPLPRLL